MLHEIRANGWAIDESESYNGICGLTAPTFDFAGYRVGTLSVTVAVSVLAPARVRKLVEPLPVRAALSERHVRIEALGSLKSDYEDAR